MISVILAGGKGQRLWPESRLANPKQFCKFLDDKSLLETTIDCLMNAGSNKVIIITNDSLLESTQVLIASRADSQMIEILSEPEGKNTAPAVGLALAKCGMVEEDSVLGIFPADHYISDIVGFTHSIQTAAKTALQGFIVTIGITPSRPETGYGYIEKDSLQINDLSNVYKVRSFLEKPDSTTAQAYINSDRYLWNSGIYIAQVKTLRGEFARYLPDVHKQILKGYNHYIHSYSNLPNISLDYGISEKTKIMAVVESNFDWCDLGSWDVLETLFENDAAGNCFIGKDILALESKNCIVKQADKTVVLYGVDNLLVVETGEIVLVTSREKSQDIPSLLEILQQKGRQDLL